MLFRSAITIFLLAGYRDGKSFKGDKPLIMLESLAAARILISASLSGLLAELLKLIVHRERPTTLEHYVFRNITEHTWSTSGLGLPSSHAAVAFGGTFALIALFPQLRWPALLMATGCVITRVAMGAHFPSDVLAGAWVGWLTSYLTTTYLKQQLTP